MGEEAFSREAFEEVLGMAEWKKVEKLFKAE